MSTVSDRLQLALTPTSDVVKNFITWRTELAGDIDSNMTKIDSAIADLQDNKQDKLSGTNGQVVGFDADGKPVAQDAPKADIFSVSLPASGWSNNAQTVNHAMLKAAGYGYIYNPDEASYGAYVSALVRCGEVTVDGQVTFSCEETPTDDITVNFMRSEANENV